MENQRGEPRRRVLLTGKIILPGGGLIRCKVRDRSDHPARLSVENSVGLPYRFRLLVGATGETFDVRVEWRRLTEIGVRILR
jgi:hypothetical protein